MVCKSTLADLYGFAKGLGAHKTHLLGMSREIHKDEVPIAGHNYPMLQFDSTIPNVAQLTLLKLSD